MSIKTTPTFADSITPGALGENIMSYMKEKANIIKLSSLSIGEYFSGIAYCTKTFYSANVNDPNTYDITFTLIDGEGVQFTAKKWGCDIQVEHINTPLYLEGTTISYTDNVVRYRVDTFKRYMTEVPKSLFLREIDGLDEQVSTFMQYVSEVETPCLKVLLGSLLNKYKYLEVLKGVTYKPTVGTRLGAKILLSNTIIHTMNIYKENLKDELDKDIYITLTVLYMIDLTIKQDNSSTSPQISTSIMNAMYNSGCFSTRNDKVQIVFDGLITTDRTKEIYTTPPECLLFNNLVQTFERTMRCKL